MEFKEGNNYVFVLPGGERLSGEFIRRIDEQWIEVRDVKNQEILWMNLEQISAVRGTLF